MQFMNDPEIQTILHVRGNNVPGLNFYPEKNGENLPSFLPWPPWLPSLDSWPPSLLASFLPCLRTCFLGFLPWLLPCYLRSSLGCLPWLLPCFLSSFLPWLPSLTSTLLSFFLPSFLPWLPSFFYSALPFLPSSYSSRWLPSFLPWLPFFLFSLWCHPSLASLLHSPLGFLTSFPSLRAFSLFTSLVFAPSLCISHIFFFLLFHSLLALLTYSSHFNYFSTSFHVYPLFLIFYSPSSESTFFSSLQFSLLLSSLLSSKYSSSPSPRLPSPTLLSSHHPTPSHPMLLMCQRTSCVVSVLAVITTTTRTIIITTTTTTITIATSTDHQPRMGTVDTSILALGCSAMIIL